MAKKDKKKKSTSVTIDFSGVTTFKKVPEGSYVVSVLSVKSGEAESGKPKLDWEFEIAEGKFKGSKLWYTTTLTENSLWKTREILEALGVEVEDGEMDIDLTSLVGETCGVTVYHETYEGSVKAKISDFMSAEDTDSDEKEEEEDEDEEDEKPAKKTSKKGKEDDEDEEDDEEETDEEVLEMDEDELEEFVEDKGLDVDLDDFSSIKKKRQAVLDAMKKSPKDDEDDEEEDDAESYTVDQVMEMSREDLEGLNDDLELDIEGLSDMKLKQARKAVIKVLKKDGLIK